MIEASISPQQVKSMTSKIETERQPWTLEAEDCLTHYETRREGLQGGEVEERLRKYGENRLREVEAQSAWKIFFSQFTGMVVYLLMAAAAAAFAFSQWLDGSAIVVVILVNAVIGFFMEFHATRSMESLRGMGQVAARVRRNGALTEVSADQLVPGDIVLLEGGDIVAADVRLLEASRLQVDESALTGESLPVDKQTEALAAETSLAERNNMLYKGTSLAIGSAEGLVVATGMQTELGHISSLVEAAEQSMTPLEERLDEMGRKLVWLTLVISAVVIALGVMQKKQLMLMIETGLALAVAAIPEGLPIVATIALAQGMRRMSQKNVLVNKLAAVETLGGTNVICTDKTGTLTENKMTLTRVQTDTRAFDISGEGLQREGVFSEAGETITPKQVEGLRLLLEVGALCNNAALHQPGSEGPESVGDPMEVGLLVAAEKAGCTQESLLESYPKCGEDAFDSVSKMMKTYHEREAGQRIAVKGAPEVLLDFCDVYLDDEGDTKAFDDVQKERWHEKNVQMAKEGLRVLALAYADKDEQEDIEDVSWVLLGFVGFLDPPREDVQRALKTCHEAGVRVVMMTGDQPVTAHRIAEDVGIGGKDLIVMHGSDLSAGDMEDDTFRQEVLGASVFARVSPEQKLDLIDVHQRAGAVVAMTGDGVNDAPALKKADIGIAMGVRGTQVAKEAADMVLQDDSFRSIVSAMEQGRVIFANIRKFILFLHSGNSCKIFAVGLASMFNTPLPILPLQILYLNMITDVFPALALGLSAGTPELMKQAPRDPKEPIVTKRHWWAIAGYGTLLTIATLGAFGLALWMYKLPYQQAATISFLTLAFAQLLHVLNMRQPGGRWWDNEVTRNPYVWGALVLCTFLLLFAVYFPPLAGALHVTAPGKTGWLLIAGMSLIPVVIGQLWMAVRYRTSDVVVNQ